MANNLTGDFDVVAEFSTGGANRVLAAMHSSGRFPHSISVRVDDNPLPGSNIPHFTAVEAVDAFGDPVVNHNQIGNPNPNPGPSIANDPIRAGLGGMINADVAGALQGTITPSHIQGVAQLQLFPPTLDVPDASGNKIGVRINLMSRFLPDAGSARLSEFMRGNLQIVANVNQIASQAANVIDIDFKADDAFIAFNPTSQNLSAEDLAAINLCIRNAMKTSTLPSSMTLPPNVSYVQLKTLFAPQNALAVLLNLGTGQGNPASINDVFLGGGDDFALALSADFIRTAFQPTIDNLLGQPPFTITIPIDVLFSTYHVVYAITLQSVSVDFQSNIVLTVKGTARQTSNKWYAPGSFDFTAQLSFSIQADGATADLVPGSVSLDTSSWLVNQFRGSATSGITQVRDQALDQGGASAAVRDMFDVNKILGNLLNSLLEPARPIPILRSQQFQLAYTSAAIQPDGIVLHGSISVLSSRPVFATGVTANTDTPAASWPAPHVEFEQIPVATGAHVQPGGLLRTPDYSALKSWIPGGTIDSYEWSTEGQSQPFLTDNNRFVLLGSTPGNAIAMVADAAVAAYSSLCLTVKGSRIAPSGAGAQQVTGMFCGYNSVSVIPGGLTVPTGEAIPMLLLAHAGQNGGVQITGHAAAQPDHSRRGTPNLIVHFADENSVAQLDLLSHAFQESGRKDAAAAILAVLGPDQLLKARYAQKVIFADNSKGAWDQVFGIENAGTPLTLIVTPEGRTAWQNEGELSSDVLAAALRTHLMKCGPGWIGMFRPNVRIGQPAPDFLFEYAPGRQLTLRKLAPRSIVLVFWKAASQTSITAVRDLQKAVSSQSALLAINDGDTSAVARKTAESNGFAANLVTDPEREISTAYGVGLWPTIVFVDEATSVTGLRFGYRAGEDGEPRMTQIVQASRLKNANP